MKALILDADKRTADIRAIKDPTPAPNEVLVKVIAIALNPIDPLYVYNPLGTTGRTIGSDFAGEVVQLGTSVPTTASQLKPGDRVAGFLQGACSINDRPGAFAELAVCPWDLLWKVPERMKLDEAATVSLCGLTAAQALFYRMELECPFPWDSAEDSTSVSNTNATHDMKSGQPAPHLQCLQSISIFIYGASTSVGLYAAQLIRHSAAASGRPISLYGAVSRKHFSMLSAQPYRYDKLVDYHDADWPDQIRQLTPGGTGVDYAYDCISEGTTVADTARTLSTAAAKVAVVRSREGGAWLDPGNLTVEPSYGAVWEGLGEMVQYQGMELPAEPRARRFAVGLYRWLSSIEDGEEVRLLPNPVRRMEGGLERVVEDGFALLGSGSVGDRESVKREGPGFEPLSAEKVVFSV